MQGTNQYFLLPQQLTLPFPEVIVLTETYDTPGNHTIAIAIVNRDTFFAIEFSSSKKQNYLDQIESEYKWDIITFNVLNY